VRDFFDITIKNWPGVSNNDKMKIWDKIKGPFGWAFEPAFAFVKAKSQPKGPKATSAFAQKQLFS